MKVYREIEIHEYPEKKKKTIRSDFVKLKYKAGWVYLVDIDGNEYRLLVNTIAHNDTTGKQGGMPGEYYHLTASEQTALHAEIHTIASHSDTSAIGSELDQLTDGSQTILHTHPIDELNFANGFNRQVALSIGENTWVNATRTFTIDVILGEANYYYYIQGIKYIQTIPRSIIIPNVSGTYYIYFDGTNTLVATEQSLLTSPVFYSYAIVALIYWNAISGEGLYGDERHGIRMSSSTHEYNHKTFGARYESGLNINGLVSGNTIYSTIDSGIIWDEDVIHNISSYINVPWLYRLGVGGNWTLVTADNEVSLNVGGTYSVWNEYTGTIWQLTEGSPTSDYYITFFVL